MLLSVDRFYELAFQSKLMGLKCSRAHITVPPRRSCRECNSMELDLVELSGKARIISFTSVFVKSKDFPIETPYVLALVSLLEGGHLLGVVVDAAESDIKNGTGVVVKFKKIQEGDKWPRIFFEITS